MVSQMSLSLGDVLRQEGERRVLDATSEEWKDDAWSAIEALASSGQTFTAEDVRRYAGDPPRQNSMGAIISRALKVGLIQFVGVAKPTRPSRHSNILRVWRGK